MWNLYYIIRAQLLEVYIFLYPSEYLKILVQIFSTIVGFLFIFFFTLQNI
jgi:hypothetical protein